VKARTRGVGFLSALSLFLLCIRLFAPLFILQFIAMLLFLLVLGSKMYSEYLLRNISLRRRDGELRVFRYEWVSVELVAENRGRLPVFMFGVKDNPGMLAVFRDNAVLGTLRAKSRFVFTWQGYCSDRGIFTFGPALIRGQDPLGLFPFSITPDEQAKLFVYPAAGTAALRSSGGIPLGTLLSANPLYEDLSRGRSLREYHPGDELRRINWKASARAGALAAGPVRPAGGAGNPPAARGSVGSSGSAAGLMVNEYESTISCPLIVFLNLDPYEYPLKKRELYLERTIEAAAALCLMASRERQELGIVIHTPFHARPESVIAPAAFTLIPILERLAALERPGVLSAAIPPAEDSGGNAPGGPPRRSVKNMLEKGKYLPCGSRYVYTGPDRTDGEYALLNSLKRYHLTTEYLIIDERALPSRVPGNSRRYQIRESGYEIV
jgi:uncharacterized protein (DUF58 family)